MLCSGIQYNTPCLQINPEIYGFTKYSKLSEGILFRYSILYIKMPFLSQIIQATDPVINTEFSKIGKISKSTLGP